LYNTVDPSLIQKLSDIESNGMGNFRFSFIFIKMILKKVFTLLFTKIDNFSTFKSQDWNFKTRTDQRKKKYKNKLSALIKGLNAAGKGIKLILISYSHSNFTEV